VHDRQGIIGVNLPDGQLHRVTLHKRGLSRSVRDSMRRKMGFRDEFYLCLWWRDLHERISLVNAFTHPTIDSRLTQQVFSITGIVDVLGVGKESRQRPIQTRFETTTHAGELWVRRGLEWSDAQSKADSSLRKLREGAVCPRIPCMRCPSRRLPSRDLDANVCVSAGGVIVGLGHAVDSARFSFRLPNPNRSYLRNNPQPPSFRGASATHGGLSPIC
jgi:YD repeat-containing protein